MHFVEWIFTRLYQFDGYFKRTVVRVLNPFDGQFFGEDSIMFNLLQMHSRPLDSRQNDSAAGLRNVDRGRNRSHSLSGNVNDHIGAFAARHFPHSFDHVFIGKNRFVGAELAGKREAMGTLAASDDKHGARSRLARRNDRGQAALACSKNHHGIAHPGVGFTMRPANTGSDRLEQRGELRWNFTRNLMHCGVRIKIHVFGQPSPECGLDEGRDEPAGGKFRARPANATAPVISGHTGPASATSKRRLDRDAIARLEAPSTGGLQADLLDNPYRLMTRNHGKLEAHRVELAIVLVDVAAA